jgi:multiple sugar transport system permease protein
MIALIAVGILFLAPLLWMVVVSFERYANINPPYPPTFVLQEPSIFNYEIALQNGYLLNAYKNSFLIAALNVLWTLFSSVVPGYAFSKGKFRGRQTLLLILLMTMMVPSETKLIPLYKIWTILGGRNTYWPVTIVLVSPFFAIVAKQFFDRMPDSLRESAFIDGSGEIATFVYIFLPMIGPVAATIVVLTFLGSWNDLLWPLIMLTEARLKTVPLYLASYSSTGGTGGGMGTTMALCVLSIIPVSVVFLLFQKYIVQSIALTGIKE